MMDETGGFYWSDSWRYQYIDPKTNTAAPVCGKPDCKHEEDPDAGCTAVRLVWNSLNSMYYYKEHLYYLNHSGHLIQTDSTGANEKDVVSGSLFVRERAEAALEQNEKFQLGNVGIEICGVWDGKMYLLVNQDIDWLIGPSWTSGGFTHVYALLIYDPETGEVKKCEDETIRKLIEDIPLHYGVNASINGDLLYISVNTTKREPLPVPEDYLENEDWQNGNRFTEEIGEIKEYFYHIPSKKIVKEW